MKKFFVIFALFCAMVLMISCGGDSKNDRLTDIPDTADSKSDEDEDTADSEPADTESDSENSDTDNSDTDNPNGSDEADSTPDDGDSDTDDADSGDSQPDSDADTGSTDELLEGIYLGIIGFNYQLNIRELSYLTSSNMTEFQDFIEDFEMDDGTALYFADYTALKMMKNYTPVPPKLQTVALVTFTDGEDTSSDGPVNDPENYNDPDVYLNAIHNKIVTNGIHGLSVEAYSIGLRSGDTGSDFKSKLEKLASSSDKAFEVSDMEEVQERFTKIAEDLYSVFKTINIDFKVLGNYSDGTRMRFSLDIYCDHDENECEKNGKNSNLYIDATYRRNGNERSFENFAYYGFSGSLTTVKCGERDQKGFYPCKFENLKYDNMDTEIKQIELWKNDNNEWKHENEALKQEDSAVNESKSSALIMLVLDCTTSLGNSKFKKLQEAGKDFIETLVNGGSAVTTTPCDPNPCTTLTNSNGNCTVSGTSYICGCKSGYDWSENKCLSTIDLAEQCDALGGNWNASQNKCTRTQDCSSKPSNTEWNTVSSITQTWNGNSWQPTTTTSYNETPSDKYCYYKCALGYEWNETVCFKPLTLGNICTGQTSCYNASSTMTCPASPSGTGDEYNFYGQDAQYTNKCTAQSFTATTWTDENGKPKGMVIDNNTGLVWEQSPSTDTYTWENRNTHCNELNSQNYGGKSNWRVPNLIELLTIVDNNKYNPATDSNFSMPAEYTILWTNNENKAQTSDAYDFSPDAGDYFSLETKTVTHKILCVSGKEMKPAVSSDFTISSDSKTVTDNRTGLMWQKAYATGKTWQQALKYCEDSTYAGYSDWRLPNKHELESLLNYEKSRPFSYFPYMSSCVGGFWSSSTAAFSGNYAWNEDFCYNTGLDTGKTGVDITLARCVRNAE